MSSMNMRVSHCISKTFSSFASAPVRDKGCGTAALPRRVLFHELREPPPISLTINQRRDWPLVDLERSPACRNPVSVMNSLELARYAETLDRKGQRWKRPAPQSTAGVDDLQCRDQLISPGSSGGDWDDIANRLALLCSHMDADLISRLLRCLARARFNDSSALESVAQGLPIAGQSASVLARWASALASFKGSGMQLCVAFSKLEQHVLDHSSEAWAASAPTMLASIVAYQIDRRPSQEVWTPACQILTQALVCGAPKMGPMQLEISAYACARLARKYQSSAENSLSKDLPPELSAAASALLEQGTVRASRFLPRGLLNFFVALERLAGATCVVELSAHVARRLNDCSTSDLDGCTTGDRYRSMLCLLRAWKEAQTLAAADHHYADTLALVMPGALMRLFGDADQLLASLGSQARASLAGRIRAAHARASDGQSESSSWPPLLDAVSVLTQEQK